MKQSNFVKTWKGRVYTLEHCDSAGKSFDKAVARLPAGPKRKRKWETWLKSSLQRLVDDERLSARSVRKEGAIAGTKGIGPGNGDLHFYALKNIPIRVYFWYSPYDKTKIYVSHYIYKDFDDLDSRDIEKVSNNFRKYEDQNE